MTFGSKRLLYPTQYLLDPNKRVFFEWVKRYGLERLFAYDEDKHPIIQKIYILTKRLHGFTYETVLKMDPDDLEEIYQTEMALIEHEKEESAAAHRSDQAND